ncbi:aspartic proteinase yapsin-3 [Trichomonascus vanleenenianus]|uniref:pepsin-like aspartic protease n=1 Tax=Trichomonascus vanleenenianus TaxID=2268995 RepID=UPI003EC9CB2B
MWTYLRLLLLLAQAKFTLCNVVSFKYDLVHRPSTQDSTRELPNRVIKAVDEPLLNEEYFYRINATVGTPPQKVQLLVDTGSSDTWVLDRANSLCIENQPNGTISENVFNCSEVGAFDRNKSSSYNYVHPNFTIRYGDNTYAKGDFGTDVLRFGNISLQGLGLGIGTEANSSIGIMGIGLKGNEAIVHANKSKQLPPSGYDNLPLLLKKQGYIDRVAYSIALEAPNSDSGDLLFGGVDHSKYTGNLWTVPMVNLFPNKTESPIEFTVNTERITLSPGHCQPPYPVSTRRLTGLMDTGTTLTYLPQDVVTQIVHSVNSQFSAKIGGYIHPCSNVQEDSVITYFFSGVPIDIRLQDAQFRLLDENGMQAIDNNNNTMCILGFHGVDHDDDVIFGDSFMRSAYVVFDLERYEISMAQARHNATIPRIEPINDTIPNSKMASQYTATQRFVGRCQFTNFNDNVVAASRLKYPRANKPFYPTNLTQVGQYRNETETTANLQHFNESPRAVVTDPTSKPYADPADNLEAPMNIKDDMIERVDSPPIYVPGEQTNGWKRPPESRAATTDSLETSNNPIMSYFPENTDTNTSVNSTAETVREFMNLIEDDSRFAYYSPKRAPANSNLADVPEQVDDKGIHKKEPVDFSSLLTQFGSADKLIPSKTTIAFMIALSVIFF